MRKQRQLNFITEYATEIVHRIVTRKLLNPQNTSMFSHYDKNHLHKNNLFHYNKEMASTLPSLNFVSTIGQQVILETQTPAMQYAQNSANSNHAATIAFVTNYVQSAMQSSNSSSGSSSNSSSGSSSNPAPVTAPEPQEPNPTAPIPPVPQPTANSLLTYNAVVIYGPDAQFAASNDDFVYSVTYPTSVTATYLNVVTYNTFVFYASPTSQTNVSYTLSYNPQNSTGGELFPEPVCMGRVFKFLNTVQNGAFPNTPAAGPNFIIQLPGNEYFRVGNGSSADLTQTITLRPGDSVELMFLGELKLGTIDKVGNQVIWMVTHQGFLYS